MLTSGFLFSFSNKKQKQNVYIRNNSKFAAENPKLKTNESKHGKARKIRKKETPVVVYKRSAIKLCDNIIKVLFFLKSK